MPKRKTGTKKRVKTTEDEKARRKYARGGRIEAYTPGEALKKKNKGWPY